MFTFEKFIKMTEATSDNTGTVKSAVFTFGRFNPPTRGHEKMINAVAAKAQEKGAEEFVFTSQTNDPKKNPLNYQTKTYFLKQLFPKANIVVDERIRTPFDAIEMLDENGYTNLTMVVGSDRVPEFEKRLKTIEDKFDELVVVSAGSRDPDAAGITGMSGTKAREAAMSNNLAKFMTATGWNDEKIAFDLMKAVRQGMGAK